VTGRLIERDGARWYRIDGLERMEPFLTTVVSDSDLWLFASSAGPLTAGRVDADHAMLPYETDDRLHRAVERSGPVTLLVREADGGREVWQPFARHPDAGCTRAIEKHVLGTALTLEEVNRAWGLRFRTTWTPSRTYGWIRTVEVTDLAGRVADVEVLDGLLDVLPAGVDAVTQQLTSNLVDSYKRSETGRWGTLAVYALESLITDRAEPAESLAATVAWSGGLDGAEVHLDERVVEDVRRACGGPRSSSSPADAAPTSSMGRSRCRRAGAPPGSSRSTPASATRRSTTGWRWPPTRPPASSSRTTSASASVGSRRCSRAPTGSSGPPTRSPTPTTSPTCCSTPCVAGCSRTRTASPSPTSSTSCATATSRCTAVTSRSSSRRAGGSRSMRSTTWRRPAGTTTSSGWCSSTSR
jgi:hypothetical protein